MTDSMKAAIGETDRRRAKQVAWNEKMGITPIGVQKRIKDIIEGARRGSQGATLRRRRPSTKSCQKRTCSELKALEKQMQDAARNLEFEKAAELRDRLYSLKEQMFGVP